MRGGRFSRGGEVWWENGMRKRHTPHATNGKGFFFAFEDKRVSCFINECGRR